MDVRVVAMDDRYDYRNVTNVYYGDGYVVVVTPNDTKTHHYFHDSELHYFHDSELGSVEIKAGKTTWKWLKSTNE